MATTFSHYTATQNMTIVVFECCLQPWLALMCLEYKEGRQKCYSLQSAALQEVLELHLVNYLRGNVQNILIDNPLSLTTEDVQMSLLSKEETESELMSSDKFAQAYFQHHLTELSIPILKAIVAGSVSRIVPTNHYNETAPNAKCILLTAEVEQILKTKFAVTSLFATTQKMVTPNSPASRLIEEMRKRKAIPEILSIDDSTQFQFRFYSIPTQVDGLYASNVNLGVDDMTQQFEDASFIHTTQTEVVHNVLIEKESRLKAFEEVNAMVDEIELSTNSAFKVLMLPQENLLDSWENIILGAKFKQSILNCCNTVLRSKTFQIEAGNFFIFEGMPGTGKTSLAKALFQKLAIGVQKFDTYIPSIFLEFSTGEIFSKYFGESPKKLLSLLSSIELLLLRHPSSFVFLLMDELETVATSRERLVSNNEVSDGLRIVNILITYLDRLKVFPNLVVIATTNMISSMDTAVADRAFRVFKFENPGIIEIEKVLRMCLDRSKLEKGDLKELEISSLLQQVANFCHVCMISLFIL